MKMKKLYLSLFILAFSMWTFAQDWNNVTKIVAHDTAYEAQFGSAVAIDSNYAIVGAWFEDTDENGEYTLSSAGAAYLFERNENDQWVQVQKIVASDRQTIACFGVSVSICGNYAIVGADQSTQMDAEGGAVYRSGSAYIFKREETTGIWVEQRKILAADRTAYTNFGFSVSIHDDFALVGAFYDDEDTIEGNAIPEAGSAYVFEKSGNNEWNQVKKLVAPDRDAGAMFGVAVSIHYGNVLVGAWQDSKDVNGENDVYDAGSAYFYHKNESGYWQFQQKVVASDRTTWDNFGAYLSIFENTAIVGAYNKELDGNDTLHSAGSAYIFEKIVDGNWEEVQILVASDRAEGDMFGSAISINNNLALVGAFASNIIIEEDTLIDAGAAYLFERNGNGNWNQTKKFVSIDGDYRGEFGNAVAVNADHLIIGAWREDEFSDDGKFFLEAGSVYIYKKGPSGFEETSPDFFIKAYPNPTHEDITIDLGKIYPELQLTIRNIHGQLILTKQMKAVQYCNIKLSGNPGLYFAEIRTSNEKPKILKVLKE